jgi:predicted DNA binding CopG/RHH family protein
MAKSIAAHKKKKKIGRPATGHDPSVSMRLPKDKLAAVDKLAEREGIGRSEALRLLVERGLEK